MILSIPSRPNTRIVMVRTFPCMAVPRAIFAAGSSHLSSPTTTARTAQPSRWKGLRTTYPRRLPRMTSRSGTKDEIGALARAIDRMGASIKVAMARLAPVRAESASAAGSVWRSLSASVRDHGRSAD